MAPFANLDGAEGRLNAADLPLAQIKGLIELAPYATGADARYDGWLQIIHDTTGAPLDRAQAPRAVGQMMRAHAIAAMTLPLPPDHQKPRVVDALCECHAADLEPTISGGTDGEVLRSEQPAHRPDPDRPRAVGQVGAISQQA